MKQENTMIDGKILRDMVTSATSWLEKNASEIDALNVFPVPDGDTGTNMLLTMRSLTEEAYRAPDSSAAGVAQAMAKGALLGARGNSGVILSQIWNGFAQALEDKKTFAGKEMAEALSQAAKMAYYGISNPVEGTILTVAKEAAAAAIEAEKQTANVVEVLESAANAAAEAVANTPTQLPALREAGVVDAGGQGFYTILEGFVYFLKGEGERMQFRKPWVITSPMPPASRQAQTVSESEIPFGYCTEMLLKGAKLKPKKIRNKLEKKGESLIVVGDDSTVRIHIHALDPGEIIHYATTLGTIHQVSIRNMDEQHQDFLSMQKQKTVELGMDTVVVVAGDGITKVFKSLGAVAIVEGGQTMNPSTKELLHAVESVPSDKVAILPNNKNVVLTAQQVQSLTKKTVRVIPSKSIPQGIAALLAFDYEADFETNLKLMTEAMNSIKTIEITKAVRSTTLGGLKIKRKQAIGFLDDALVDVANSPLEALQMVLNRINLAKAEIITLYYGDNTDMAEAEKASAAIKDQNPGVQVDIVQGGQPFYNYIVSVE